MRWRELGRVRLAELQRHLVKTACGADPSPALLRAVDRQPGAGLRRRLAAYRQTVEQVHRQALEDAFPVCTAILGARYWRGLTGGIIGRPGSPDRDLTRYGETLPGLLSNAVEERPELGGYEYLPDLAALEWHVHRARYAADAEQFDFASFATLPETTRTRLRLRTAPGLAIGSSAWPVDALWQNHRESGVREDLPVTAVHYAVHRDLRLEPTVTRLSPTEKELLGAVMAGSTLGTIEARSAGDRRLANRLYDWIMAGWIVGFAEAG